MTVQQHSDDYKKNVTHPGEIPPKEWKNIALQVNKELSKDNIGIIAAGIAFYAFLAIFPAIAAIISIFGLIVDTQTIQNELSDLAEILPPQSSQLIQNQLAQLTSSSPAALGWGLVISVILSLWSANQGTRALFQGLNIAYDETDNRGYLRGNAITLLFTLLGVLLIIICMSLVVALPAALHFLNLPGSVHTLIDFFRWIVLALLLVVSLSVLYRYAPDRKNPDWRWVSWGAVISTLIWIAGSWAFSFYVANFGNYNAMYGSLAAVVILLLWFSLSAFIILLGAEINAEIEHQRVKTPDH